MILIIHASQDRHVDYVISKLNNKDLFVKLDVDTFPSSTQLDISLGKDQTLSAILCLDEEIDLSLITHIWCRRYETLDKFSHIPNKQHKEFAVSESNALLSSICQLLHSCVWVNHPIHARSANAKIHQLHLATKLGIQVPETLVTQNPHHAKQFIEKIGGKAIVKTLKKFGFEDENGKQLGIATHLLNQNDMRFLEKIRYCPTLLQKYIPKDVELRITVVGEEVFAVAIHSQNHEITSIDWRLGIYSNHLHYEIYNLPHQIIDFCISLTKKLGLLFSTIDMIKSPNGDYVFLEANPNGQWLWLEKETGIQIAKTLIKKLTQ